MLFQVPPAAAVSSGMHSSLLCSALLVRMLSPSLHSAEDMDMWCLLRFNMSALEQTTQLDGSHAPEQHNLYEASSTPQQSQAAAG